MKISKDKLIDALRLMNELQISGQKNFYIAFNTMAILQETITALEELEEQEKKQKEIDELNKTKPQIKS